MIKEVKVRCSDTDILILLTAFYPTFTSHQPDVKVVIDFGTGPHRTLVNINQVADQITIPKCRGLLLLHSLSGCDYLSSFFGIVKMKWMDWYLSLTDQNTIEIFNMLSRGAPEVSHEAQQILVTVLRHLYKCTTEQGTLEDARFDILIHQNIDSLRPLPPSSSAFTQHVMRAAYVAGHVWGTADVPSPTLPAFTEWGWTQDSEGIYPVWTTRLVLTLDIFKTVTKSCKCQNIIIIIIIITSLVAWEIAPARWRR